MKKLACLALSAALVLALCACSNDSKTANTDNVTSYSADSNTIALVNDAFAATKKALDGATALGFTSNFKRTFTVGEETSAMRIGYDVGFVPSGNEAIIGSTQTVKAEGIDSVVEYYYDTKDVYASKLGSTYLLSQRDETRAFFSVLVALPAIFDASSFEALDTTVVNTENGGRGFIIEYKFDDGKFDPKSVYSEQLYIEGTNDTLTLKPTGLRVSGIIDESNRLVSETITYTYSYDFTETDESEVDPDNSDAALTSPKEVQKTAVITLIAELNFNYNMQVVTVPDQITLKPADGSSGGLKELSLADFNAITENK